MVNSQTYLEKNTTTTKTKNNTTTINTARTTTSSPILSTKSTTVTITPYSTDWSVPTHYNNGNTETIDIAGEIIKEAQTEITSSPIFIPTIGLLFALIPVFFFCLCYAKCWRRKKPKQIV